MESEMQLGENNGDTTSTTHHQQWTQWQLLDSILPTGGFAHSYGLEAAVQARIVMGILDLETHVAHVLENTGSLLLPFVYTVNKSPNVETWSRLNQMLEATLTNEITRKASISQGSALLRVAASVFLEVPSLKTMRDELLHSQTVSIHHAPIFGLICGLLGFDSGTTQRAYMFMTMRDLISAATRLNLVGPMGAAVLQHQMSQIAEEMVKRWMDRPGEEACQTSPLLDTVQGCHGYCGKIMSHCNLIAPGASQVKCCRLVVECPTEITMRKIGIELILQTEIVKADLLLRLLLVLLEQPSNTIHCLLQLVL